MIHEVPQTASVFPNCIHLSRRVKIPQVACDDGNIICEQWGALIDYMSNC
eukprot:m.170698 g.170698  ORF g.170698 m.170698 type:complete len:50 (-) comp31617_c0_seq3:471-620(-)